ncbi:MAG: hypothetical protein Q8M53_04360 [Burkholderiales bacterium]|nr:hypothetical protein [Burkholderiales bacterium]MDP3715863.1 hypothetical protein [Burkholderiales bacterium]
MGGQRPDHRCGRGKAGLIKKADSAADVSARAADIIGKAAKGRTVNAVRVEQQVHNASEAYIAMMLDPAVAGATMWWSIPTEKSHC